jgi:hypothetical protein
MSKEEPLMNFTKGEILKELLRLIGSARRSGLLIADVESPRLASPSRLRGR